MPTNETLIDRVVQRLRAAPMGDLITEEDLHELCKAALPKAFLESYYVSDGRDSYGSQRTKLMPAPIVETMREMLKPLLQEQMQKWFIEHADIFRDHFAKVLEEGTVEYVQRILNERSQRDIREVLVNIIQKMNEERARQGLPWLPTI